MLTTAAVARAIILLVVSLAPPVLGVLALRDWKRKRQGRDLRTLLSIALGTLLLANWILLFNFLIQSETPYGSYYKPSWSTGALFLLTLLTLALSAKAVAGRWQLALGSATLLALWVFFAYVPSHWLGRATVPSVSIDDHPVPASVYIGNPTDSEVEAVALVRLQDGSDYFLDFDSEKVRQANRSEYVRLPGGVWCFRSMEEGAWTNPLPFRQVNEFRIPSRDGHVVTVQF